MVRELGWRRGDWGGTYSFLNMLAVGWGWVEVGVVVSCRGEVRVVRVIASAPHQKELCDGGVAGTYRVPGS